ncbi:MAG: ATP-dependent zinc metalloprotease FtsH [Candidatus Cloacimonetes bacterium]|nr:ATP-dependent zinc metalloprotease FtsH [Candidatus Cloacimonadota bacterium]
MAIIILTLFAGVSSQKDTEVRPYSSFIKLVKSEKVLRVTVRNLTIKYEDKKNEEFVTTAPHSINPPYLDLLIEKGVNVEFQAQEEWPEWFKIILNLAPWILFIGLWFYFINKMQGGSPRGMSFGKSKVKVFNESKVKTTFEDVAGCDEAKEELSEVIEFLKYPKKFLKMGARVPRGVLMMGPPGTGKTLLARAVAGEANVPFFHISGSDFVEMFVGVGASRVRDLFEQGRKSSPCLIFIDEIDAVGRQRGNGMSGGNDEREQTLNQLLVEMDGFDGDTGIMVIAATNRADILDQALLRPGRFDRQVTIDLPDIKGREGILGVHVKNVPMDDSINLEVLAKATPGFSGADLANMVNEAALLAARVEDATICMRHLEEARDKVMMGPERRSKVMPDKEIKNTAYHEAGHALISLLVPNSMEIHKATIIPRGRALGMVSYLPKEEMKTKEELIDDICVSMGGRIAEEIQFGTYTPGASSDIQHATSVAKAMITKWGMSKNLGTVLYTESNEYWGKSYSETTAREIDQEVKEMITQQLKRAKELIESNMTAFVAIAEALLKYETLTKDELKQLVAGEELVNATKIALIKPKVDLSKPAEEREPKPTEGEESDSDQETQIKQEISEENKKSSED